MGVLYIQILNNSEVPPKQDSLYMCLSASTIYIYVLYLFALFLVQSKCEIMFINSTPIKCLMIYYKESGSACSYHSIQFPGMSIWEVGNRLSQPR